MVSKKAIKEYEAFTKLNIIGLIVIFSLGYLIGNYNVSTNFTIQDVCLSCSQVYGEKDYQTLNLTKFFDTIAKNCGSPTYLSISKKYGEDYYSVFTSNNCKEDGYCKIEYIKVDKCLYSK